MGCCFVVSPEALLCLSIPLAVRGSPVDLFFIRLDVVPKTLFLLYHKTYYCKQVA